MSYSCGLVGLPNVGKTTIFNILTKSSALAENYPFCTKDSNVGVAVIDDPRVHELQRILRPKSIRRATVKFVDIAGLVKDAHKGEGLGNQFLHYIREVDALAHVLRVFEDERVTHIYGDVNPMRDYEIVRLELILADLDTVTKSLEKFKKEVKAGKTFEPGFIEGLETIKATLEAGKMAIEALNGPRQLKAYAKSLLTGKPFFIILNISESELSEERYVEKLESIITMLAEENIPSVPFCVSIEEMIAEMSPEEKKQTLEEYNMPMSGVDLTCFAGLKALDLITFFTTVSDELSAWTIKANSTALTAAGKIHSDIAKNFVRAEVISYQDFVQLRGELNAKNAGRMRLEGKDYIVQDGDVIRFRFNKAA
ncbi:MAG: redox-regulated ATPase YchF [Deltaproteobacteria bacterium]|nr:redox-regulated ATPase YchF [Deltaproteobacteria bacterium]MCX7952221.1 redox-regulated ATPase YchF [Deltaproteobacteria bacterium]